MSSENPIKVIPHYVVCPLGIKIVGQIHLRIRLSHLTNWSISSLQTIHCNPSLACWRIQNKGRCSAEYFFLS